LAVVGSIASYKLAKYEGWGSTSRDPGATASAFIDHLAALEGKLKLELNVERTHPEAASPPPIDRILSKTAG